MCHDFGHYRGDILHSISLTKSERQQEIEYCTYEIQYETGVVLNLSQHKYI